MNTVIVENCKTLFIGRRGENEVTEVVFDFSEWQAEFGNGVIDLFVKRNGDSAAYPVVLSVDGTVATWLVTDADTAVVGSGKIEFVYTVNEKVAKSAVFPFFVGEDIGQASSEPPDPYESWIETLTELGTETQANAQAAAQSASDAADSAASASESAGQAEDSAEDAEAWAVGERNGEPVSVGDETYENSAKYWAWKAKTDAPVTSVNGEAGDIVLDLDDIPNGETYARATPEQLAQIGENADDIADIDAMIPNTTSESNPLVNVSFLTNRLTSYRTSAAQDTIDAGKQEKITAYGILKRDRSGNITAAIAGADYVTADALNSYRKATAQDAIDNAQNQNINKNTAAINTMQPAATAADIGKALIVKTVADGKPTSYEYGEAGGGGSTLTAGDGIDITEDVISNTQGIEYIAGTQTAATSKWTGVSTDETLKVGKIIAYYLPYAGTSTAATLALTMADGTATREISLQLKPNATVTTQFPAGSIIILVYDGTYWRVNASYDTDTNTNPTGYCLTNGSVAAKAAVCSFGYRGDTNYFPCLFRFANTATDATLAITTYAPEAAPIYVNGARTSATNTFGAGVILFLYYNGAYYCYNDGRFPILVDGAVTSVQEYATGLLVNYRTAAAQDTIDAGKQAKITASGILKGDGAGGVSAAVAGVDYLKSAPVTSVNGQTGDVTIQTATDAQVTTAVNTWLGENVVQETGYVLDASLTMSNAAPPASAVGDLKSAINYQTFIVPVIDKPALRNKSNNAFVDNGDGTYTVGTTDYGNATFLPSYSLPAGNYLLYGVPNGYSFLSETTSHNDAIATNDTNEAKIISITDSTKYYTLGYRISSKPSESFVIAPYLKRIVQLHNYVIKPFDVANIVWEHGYYFADGSGGVSDSTIRSQPDLFIQVCAGSTIGLKEYAGGERLRFCIYSLPNESGFKERVTLSNQSAYVFSEDCYIRIYMYYSDDRTVSDFSLLTTKAAINIVQYVRASESSDDASSELPVSWANKIQSIQQTQGTKYTFAIQTDTHYYDGYGDNAGGNLKLFTNYIGFDFVANLGDVIRGYGDETIDSPESMRAAMTEIMHRYVTGISCPLMIAMGNHDTNKMWADEFGGNPFDLSEVWGREFRPAFNTNLKAITKTGLMYYYTDFDDVRVIVLNTQDGGNGAFGIGQTQIDWLTNTALNTDKTVLVLSHVPLVDGWSVTSNYVSSYASAVAAIKAFQTNGGTVIGCMSGHTHTQESKTVDGILYVTFTNGADLCEVVQVDITNKAINTIPVGFTGVGRRSFTFA